MYTFNTDFLATTWRSYYFKNGVIVALSTTNSELYLAVLTAQDMMFVYHIMINMLLAVKLPMFLYCDNQETVDLANNWSVSGRTRHVDVKQNC